MKKYLFLLVILICGCVQSDDQLRANHSAERYIQSLYGNPKYFRSISFSPIEKRRYATTLDTALIYAGVDTDNHHKIEKYADSESEHRPDLADKNTEDLYNIKHNKLTYYLLIYSFRVDSGLEKKFLRYRFELDTAFNVINARDISYTHSKTE